MRAAGVLVVAALAALAGGARAQTTAPATLMEGFRSFCLGARPADREAALAAADKAGWLPVPDAMLGSFAGMFQKPAGRIKSDAAGMQFMVLGEQTQSIGGTPILMRACGVGAGTSDPAAVEALMVAEAGVPKNAKMSTDARSGWVYSDEGGRHVPLDMARGATVLESMKAGRLRMLMMMNQPATPFPNGLSIVVVAVPSS